MLMVLTSYSNAEYGLPDQTGQRTATGRFWTFYGTGESGVLNLFVASPGALPVPKIGATYEIIKYPGKTGSAEKGLIGHDQTNNQLYQILRSAEEE